MNDAHKVGSGFDFLSFFWPSLNQMAISIEATSAGGGGAGGNACGSRNALLWMCIFFGLVYFAFGRALKAILIRHRFPRHTCNATIRFSWNCCFYTAAALCLALYFYMNLAATIRRDSGPLFPKYDSPLVMPTDNCSMFASMTHLVMAFYITAGLVALNDQDYAEGILKLVYVLVLSSLNANGFENFFVMMNIWVSLFCLATDLMQLVALHSENANIKRLRFLLLFRMITWTYVWLHLLPFDFLVPTLYAKKFKLWLNVCLWVWYGANVWYSPILYFCYHQFYHQYEACTGDTSIARCVLVKNSPDYQHYMNLQQAYYTIQLGRNKQIPQTPDGAARTYQTIKCMIALKRKLKRIRANNEPNNTHAPPLMPL